MKEIEATKAHFRVGFHKRAGTMSKSNENP